jgi:uncharacterized protein YwqG
VGHTDGDRVTSFVERLFGRKPDRRPTRDVAALTASLARPALRLVAQEPPSRSHFGGAPGLPTGMPWPERNGARLDFLARVSLADLHRVHRVPWLPDEGALLFCYDVQNQPWGFDPKDRGSAVVRLVPDLTEAQQWTSVPVRATPGAVRQRSIGVRRIEVLPSLARDPVHGLAFTDVEADTYAALTDAPFADRPKHQVAGFPAPVQDDEMEFECELVTHGLYCGDSSGYEDPRAAVMRPNAANWRLLLQVDTDDELGVMWGDGGLLYFWVREDEARAADFTNIWVVLQCT